MSASGLMMEIVYIQDIAPSHTARDTAAFLDQDVEVMDWPARSPDMIPIEHVWDQMSVYLSSCLGSSGR